MNAVATFGTNHLAPQARRWGLSVMLVLSFLLLALVASGTNLTVFRLINGVPWPAGEWFWSNVTVLGDTMVLFCLLLPFIGRRPMLVWSVMVAVIVVSLLVHGAKMMLELPRPPAVLGADELQLIGFRAITGSFPSGHTAAAFVFAAGVCLLQFPLAAKLLTVFMAVLVGVSRVAVGIHWPVDVVAGALMGWIGMMISIWLAMRWPVGIRLRAQRITAALLVLAALFTVWGYDGGYPQARGMLVVLPLLLLALALPALRRLYSGDGR